MKGLTFVTYDFIVSYFAKIVKLIVITQHLRNTLQ